jgi:hypothetical protein
LVEPGGSAAEAYIRILEALDWKSMAIRHEIEEIDVVILTEPVGHWPAGAEGTVVIDHGEMKLLEMAGEYEDPLDLPLVHRDKLKLVAKYHH